MVPYARVAIWPWLLSSAIVAISAVDGCALGSLGSVSAGGVDFLSDGSTVGSDGGAISAGGDASACRPGDVETYQPAYHPATAAWQGVCRQDQINGFYDACLDPQATTATCGAFSSDKANVRCIECIVTPDGSSHYGPLIDHLSFITTNVAGCIELAGSGLSCAKPLQALSGCELAACEANCPVNDNASRVAFDACAGQAARAGCQSYNMAAACLGAEGDAGLVASCLIQTFKEFYDAVVPLFCGAPKVDSGVPPFDASFDVGSWASVDATADAAADVRGDAISDGRSDAVTDAPADPPRDAANQ
jgi:hypothetical protein